MMWLQSSHLTINGTPVSHWNLGMLYGHATWQYRQPMQRSGSQVTMPYSRFLNAPIMHALAQPGSMHCMHCDFMYE